MQLGQSMVYMLPVPEFLMRIQKYIPVEASFFLQGMEQSDLIAKMMI